MGNCLRKPGQVVEIMKMDVKILKLGAPIKVHEVLSEYKGHTISSTLPAQSYLQPHTIMAGGYFHYLVRFHGTQKEVAGRESTVLRIKFVTTKKELRRMIENGVLSIDRELYQLQNQEGRAEDESFHDDYQRNRIRKSALKTIPEVI